MVEDGGGEVATEDWLFQAKELVPIALAKAREVKGFTGRWKMIITKLEQIPSCLSDLSSHPCFSKNTLCKEQLQAVSKTLKEATELAEFCIKEKYEGKLRMQSDLDALSGKLDLNLRDCGLLIKTGVLGEATLSASESEADVVTHGNIRELLARLQIGHLEAKHKALDHLVEVMKDDEKNVLAAISRSNVAALVQLLTATSPRIREKTVAVISSLAESGSCEDWLVSEGVLPPLIRLVESGSVLGKEKAVISLQRLSMSSETARAIVGHGGVRPLVDLCRTGDSVSQAASACTLKNISAVPEVRQSLAEEGIVRVMINLLSCGILMGSKEYAAECLQNLTASNETLRRNVISEGGVRTLLAYLDGPLPQESAVGALRNLVGSVSEETLVSMRLLPRLVHVLKSGSLGAQQAAVSALCRVCTSTEMKKRVGESGCIPFLVKMLEAKSNGARELAAQAIASLMIVSQNKREVKKDDKSVPNMVQLLDPSPQNTAKKYAVSCLGSLSSSKKCKKLMISYGAIGYLKKLTEMDVPGARKLHERLERGRMAPRLSKEALLSKRAPGVAASGGVTIREPSSRTGSLAPGTSVAPPQAPVAAVPISAVPPPEEDVIDVDDQPLIHPRKRAKKVAQAPPPPIVEPSMPEKPEITSVGACLTATLQITSECRRVTSFLMDLQARGVEHEELKKKVAERDRKLEEAATALDQLRKEKEDLQKNLTKAETDRKELRGSVKKFRSEAEGLRKDAGELKRKLEEKEAEAASLREKVPKLEAEVTLLQGRVIEVTGRAKELEAEKDGLENEAADQYVAGYHLALEHVEAVYPDAHLELGDFGPFQDVVEGKLVGPDVNIYSSRLLEVPGASAGTAGPEAVKGAVEAGSQSAAGPA